jgi:cation diffusion facilitator CzcD-associated flavoprotein CzcO
MESEHEVVIVGAGFAGLGAAHQLRRAGVTDVVVVERDRDVGGTWQQNTYPGCACDIPTELYSFSFALNPDWSRVFAPQVEIQAYLRRFAEESGVLEQVRLGTEVTRLEWDDAAARWRVHLSGGEVLKARFLVSAIGGLSRAAFPDLPGLERFEGRAFHSQRWDHAFDLSGKRVAVVGTGASAIQIVPALAPKVAELTVFQRTPPWILPRGDRPVSALKRAMFRRVPGFQRLMRWKRYWLHELDMLGFLHPTVMARVGERQARRHLEAQVADPGLRERLTPRYTMGCKRVLLSDDYYPALQRENVRLVTAPAAKVEGRAVVDAEGGRHEVDALVLATGFHATDPLGPLEVVGRGGVGLKQAWANGLSAHLGTMVAGFPNLFILAGPNTGIGHTSLVFMIECQLRYLLGAVRAARRGGFRTVEVRPEVERAFTEALERRSRRTVWLEGGCRSWYLDEHGKNGTTWPDFTFKFWWRTRTFAARQHLFA